MIEYKPHLIAENLSYLLLVWFFVISVFGGIKDFAVSCCLCILWLIYCWIFTFNLFDPLSYIELTNKIILIDGSFALACAMLLKLSPTALKHSLLLCFATLCHIMIILSLKTKSYGFFYLWYDELIILVGLLQMVISYNGFTKALHRIQGLLRGRNVDSNCANKGLFAQKTGKAKT